ncbi:MAG: hypothetical protein E7252_01630 [Lachnospira sp.]|nr:hypothetical protein [Lachnospira sp.]
MEKFIPINKNTKLLSFKIEENIFGSEDITEIERFNDLPFWFEDIKTWLDQRNYAKHKNHLKNI